MNEYNIINANLNASDNVNGISGNEPSSKNACKPNEKPAMK